MALLLVILSPLFSCKSGKGLFGAKRLHEQYAEKLRAAGLHETALGRQWFEAADKALSSPQTITLPYKEVGYFPAEQPRAAGLKFTGKQGEKLLFRMEKNPATGFALYMELWRSNGAGQPSFVKAADSTQQTFEQEVEGNEIYILRLQPELLKSGDYTLSISVGPTLAYPVPGGRVGSIWGDARDAGVRRHEGVDIFAARRTPAVASADGVVTSVREGGIGGKTIFMRPSGKSYSLYYAHLEEQLATPGQRVKLGDTIGLVGNTGNAATTSPHLHFGIYTAVGAVDPLPFIRQKIQEAPDVRATASRLANPLRTTTLLKTANRSYTDNAVVFPLAVSERTYRVVLPDGALAEVATSALQPVETALRQVKIKRDAFLLESPKEGAPKKNEVVEGTAVKILGYFGDYSFVETGTTKGWLPSDRL